jgi:hypothetical protein
MRSAKSRSRNRLISSRNRSMAFIFRSTTLMESRGGNSCKFCYCVLGLTVEQFAPDWLKVALTGG